MDIQLIFPKHTEGELARDPSQPPSVGLLTLAAWLQEYTDADVEVQDENLGQIRELEADIIGLGTWYSNYDRTLELAEQAKKENPGAKIVIGGPHASGIARRIVRNNQFVDYAVQADGEVALEQLVKGAPAEDIPNITYRAERRVRTNRARKVVMDRVPPIGLDVLRQSYEWDPSDMTTMSAFPVSGFRGCFQTERCDYCSIATLGLEEKSPENFWEELRLLHELEGIDYFFETGDTFLPKRARDLASDDIPDVALRVYSYPGLIRPDNVDSLSAIRVRNVFIGIESVLVFEGRGGPRKYRRDYKVSDILEEIRTLERNGITVMPSFILGLPGETDETLERNMELVRQIAEMPNVDEMVVNTPLPLPGSTYFGHCMEDIAICRQYWQETGYDLQETDRIDYHSLSRMFVDHTTSVSNTAVLKGIQTLRDEYGDMLGHFGSEELR